MNIMPSARTETFNKAELISVNGIELYYEAHGEGEPLLLLHGWTQTSSIWKEYVPEFAKLFTVYAIDLRGHGKTSALTREFSIKSAADDILALIKYLGLEKVNAIGLSYGGLVLLQLCSTNQEKIKSMILVGSSSNYNGKDNQNPGQEFKIENLDPAFVNILRMNHTRGDHQIRAMFDSELNYEIRLTEEQLQLIKVKTLIVSGDRDNITGIDAPFVLHRNLHNSFLWILPNTGHPPISEKANPEFLRLSFEFLNNNWQ